MVAKWVKVASPPSDSRPDDPLVQVGSPLGEDELVASEVMKARLLIAMVLMTDPGGLSTVSGI